MLSIIFSCSVLCLSSYCFVIAVPTTLLMVVVCPARAHGSVTLLILVMPPIEIYVEHNDRTGRKTSQKISEMKRIEKLV